jgi:uncharacterized OB-fold protein
MCNRCFCSPQEAISLGSAGRLYAFSRVHVSSAGATPYTLGFVDFPSNLRVLAPIFGPTTGLSIDDEVIVTVMKDSQWGFRKKSDDELSVGIDLG